MKNYRWAPPLLLAAMLAACGGGGDGVDSGSPGGGGNSALSCQDAFSPEKLAAGKNCTPLAESYCPVATGLSVLNPTVLPCTGVTVQEFDGIAVDGLASSKYLAISSGSGPYDSVYVALHYLLAKTDVFANVVRLSELAKARKALVLVPQAPSLLGSTQLLGSRWPTLETEPIGKYVAFIDAVVADALGRFPGAAGAPLLVSGLSNGAVMAYEYACASADKVGAVLATGGDLSSAALDRCQPAGPVGSVIIHGDNDPIAPYGTSLATVGVQPIHEHFKALNDCVGTDSAVDMPLPFDDLVVSIDSTAPCAGKRRDFLVTIHLGGHNWPGGSASDSELSTIGLLGRHTRNFDATLQGYDLLLLAAGEN